MKICLFCLAGFLNGHLLSCYHKRCTQFVILSRCSKVLLILEFTNNNELLTQFYFFYCILLLKNTCIYIYYLDSTNVFCYRYLKTADFLSSTLRSSSFADLVTRQKFFQKFCKHNLHWLLSCSGSRRVGVVYYIYKSYSFVLLLNFNKRDKYIQKKSE